MTVLPSQMEIDLAERLRRLAEFILEHPPARPWWIKLGMRIPGLGQLLTLRELSAAMLKCWSSTDYAVCELAERMLGRVRCGELMCDALVLTGHYVRSGVDSLQPCWERGT